MRCRCTDCVSGSPPGSAGHLEELEQAEPELPLEDRAADTWVALADLAGGSWPTRARTAALVLSGEADAAEVEASLGVRLLADVRETVPEAVIASEELVRRLRARPESPWEAFELDQRSLSRRLRPYSVRPDRVYLSNGRQARGYKLEDFTDAFVRYLRPLKDGDQDEVPPGGAPSRPVTPSDPQVSPVTDTEPVTDTSVTAGQTVTGLTRADDAMTRRDATCQACGGRLDPAVAAGGFRTHPACDLAAAGDLTLTEYADRVAELRRLVAS